MLTMSQSPSSILRWSRTHTVLMYLAVGGIINGVFKIKTEISYLKTWDSLQSGPPYQIIGRAEEIFTFFTHTHT